MLRTALTALNSLIMTIGIGLVPVCTEAMAQTWPQRPVSIVVPLAAGGTADGVARVLAEGLAERWGVRVNVENKSGGNAIIGTDAVAKSPADGYTLSMGLITSQAANPFLFDKLPYNVEKDFTGIALLATSPIFLVVHPSVPAKNLQEFIAFAKANPDKLAFASTGYGSSFHLATEQLTQRTGIKMTHVPYRGMGAAVIDLLSGNIQVAMDVSTMAQVKEGKLKALGVASAKRYEGEPDIPSFAEQGLPDLDAGTWLSLHGPAGLPADIRDKINADINAVLSKPEIRARMLTMHYVPAGGSAAELDSFLGKERAKIGEIIRVGNIRVQQ
ncbi:MAG TPA: tripartite tricarboxylate transporter substrate binding protein [Bosea sp. (in: a-proteobacteria)]|jgi:tripartite-type tricarboxylate transporter receptor subunit TctC|uniref:Bug family tripartite tricarboxylate transporter substrate binding protein n=1 Tax=Bosea sp. (in: a-proteobacteria) TaxID=1871050 RepID=UPI002E160A3E|nr:tripartite tricarboxylate transporter substrate binding protein [Bosea sp. (in: a-proteobacteria)]